MFEKAFITGASSGIGLALARLLADKGVPLIIQGRNSARLEALADELRAFVPVEIVVGDLAVKEDRARIIEAIKKSSPDLLVNNAGMGLYGTALSYPTEIQMSILSVNAEAVLELTLEGARTMVSCKKEGVILNVSSVVSFIPFPRLAVYAASKAFITHLSEGLDAEMQPYGVRVLAACPGATTTEFATRAGQHGAAPAVQQRNAMTAEFAAQEIWKQLQKRQRVRTFNWAYRCMAFLAHYLIPRSLLFAMLRKFFINSLPKRPIIHI